MGKWPDLRAPNHEPRTAPLNFRPLRRVSHGGNVPHHDLGGLCLAGPTFACQKKPQATQETRVK